MRPITLITVAAAALALAGTFSTLVPAQADPAEEATYVGSKTCKKCHFKQHRAWRKNTLKSKSLDALRPTSADDSERTARKKAAGLDPEKDYSTDEKCLACHTTGYGKNGGYPKDVAANAELAEKLGEVGCEACHGPGSKYVQFKKDEAEKDAEATFTFEQMAPMGLIKPDEKVCAGCHNDDNPAKPAEALDFEATKGLIHTKKKKK